MHLPCWWMCRRIRNRDGGCWDAKGSKSDMELSEWRSGYTQSSSKMFTALQKPMVNMGSPILGKTKRSRNAFGKDHFGRFPLGFCWPSRRSHKSAPWWIGDFQELVWDARTSLVCYWTCWWIWREWNGLLNLLLGIGLRIWICNSDSHSPVSLLSHHWKIPHLPIESQDMIWVSPYIFSQAFPNFFSLKSSAFSELSRLIGSHSHELGCFDADSGAQRWRRQLSDRIEAGCACAVIHRQHRVFAVCCAAALRWRKNGWENTPKTSKNQGF